MKFLDEYRHFKGGRYLFFGIALPMDRMKGSILKSLQFEKEALYHENKENIDIYSLDDYALFIDSDLPHVIYHGEDGTVWAREIDNFFGYKEVDGVYVKRFTKIGQIMR